MTNTTTRTSDLNTSAPWSRLVHDVLREIFILNVDSRFVHPELANGMKLRYADLPQLSVSHVCSSWRRLSLSIPQLWTSVQLYDITDFSMNLANVWLSRSRPLAVSIAFGSIYNWNLNNLRPDWESLTKEFLSTYQLKYLKLRTPFVHILPDLPQHIVASLQEVDIRHDITMPPAHVHLDGLRYPALASVDIGGSLQIAPSSAALRTLTAYDIRDLSVSQCWNIFRGLPSLEVCKIGILKDDHPLPPATKICLPRLRDLWITIELPGTTFFSFFRPLVLPNLEILTAYGEPLEWSHSSFLTLAAQSNFFPRLSRFRLGRCVNEVDVFLLLQAIPYVQEIFIEDDAVFTKAGLDALASGHIGEKLTHLTFARLLGVSHDEFLDMVVSRMKKALISDEMTGKFAPFKRIDFTVAEMVYRDNGIRERLESILD